LGDEIRQLVAGIGRQYEPEALIGKQIIVIANLQPRMLMGLESKGMLFGRSWREWRSDTSNPRQINF